MANNDKKTGRFTPGNKAAKGNPYTRKAAEFRKAMYNSVTTEDVAAIIQTLKAEALSGDLKAINILLDRLLGPATIGLDLLERLEHLEALFNRGGETEQLGQGED